MKKSLLSVALLFAGSIAFAQTPRLSLFEEFTGETCPPCASTNPGLNATLLSATNATKIVAIKWQVPIPSAPTKTWSLYQTNKAEIDWRYRSSGSGYGYPSQWTPSYTITSGINSAPTGVVDGQHQWTFGAQSDHPMYLSDAVIATAQSYTSAFSITMNSAWNKSCTARNLTITIQATAAFSAVGNLVFRTVMVERLIQFSVQPGTNGETKFEDVAIKSFPSIQAGTPMAPTWTVGQTQTFTMSCTIPSYTRDKEEIAMVGFIQDDGNKKVAQAARAGTLAMPAEALAQVGTTVDVTCSNNISPIVSIRNDGPSAITAMTVVPYTDNVAGSNYVWTGNLAPGATTVIALGAMPTSTTPGSHLFMFDVDLPVPNYQLTVANNKVNYVVSSSYQGSPVAEGFTLAAFPPANWTVVNPDAGANWSRSTLSGGYLLSGECTKYDFYNNKVAGDRDEFFLPPMNLTGVGSPTLSFDIAYARRTATTTDMLQVYASDNCGLSWTKFFEQNGAALTKVALATSAYVPDPLDASHWRTEYVELTGLNKNNVLVKFVTTADGNGNNLYLDNVNLAQVTDGTAIKELTANGLQAFLFPNPAEAIANIVLRSENAGKAKITIVNTLGQSVFTNEVTMEAGNNKVQVNVGDLASGVYYVVISTTSGSVVKKLSVN